MGPQDTPKLSEYSTDEQSQNVPIEILTGQHRDIFTRAVGNVLSTEIAQITYAQIADGLPLSSVEKDTYAFRALTYDHPLHTNHIDLCPTALEKTRELYADFNPHTLCMDCKLIHAYQAASPGSRAFQTRLIELIAVAIHQIAVQIFKLDTGLHKDDGIASWTPPKENTMFWRRNPNDPPPTLFRHRFYRDYDQYPEGVADGVGYWAEARILGGVALFDRRKPESVPSIGLEHLPSIDPDAIYFHSNRKRVTYRIYGLLDSQKQQLLDFLLSEETPPASCPLPILGDDDNRQRVDPEEPIVDTGIYRDEWERKPPPRDKPDGRVRGVKDGLNYPTMDDWKASRSRGFDKKEEMYRHLEEDSDP
ncbi:hypothetical protein VE01_04877 [Pseudogymnoascus verrucosus]|uniref:Uncharacterized protein n=1 Tax=Pseudogymnoascus verrucosus TaxID=342668 RepID=A0A1B8GMR9_9PEZI|nr:uncharacterized protein VE01_04877 [Pseudogymnoascus verrucosus]OBT97131.1 hypothetical protein VE01_04877 [Pseudogymnoascus verrucosus]